LRLFAWRRTYSHDKDRLDTAEPFDCDRDCKRADGSWDDDARSARGCTLFGAPPVDRKPKAARLYQITLGTPYMGRYPDPSLAGSEVLGIPQNPATPYEPPENGCPGAWYRTPFIDSIWPFTRRRLPGGGRVDNPKFTDAHWLIRDAVRSLEVEEERAQFYLDKIAEDRAREAAPPREDPPPRGGRRKRR
jgi:hypothetical protein